MKAIREKRTAPVYVVAFLALLLIATPILAKTRVVRWKEFSGTSDKGDFDAALETAIANASNSSRIPDHMTEWKFKDARGTQGGIAGFNKITVTISAQTR